MMKDTEAVVELAKLQSRFEVIDPKRTAILRGMGAIKRSIWHVTSQELPAESGAVLCYFDLLGNTAISVEWFSTSQQDFLPIEENGNVLNTPTHWMALPKSPSK